MASLVFAGIVLLALFLLLALFARGGPTETISAKGLPPELAGVAKLSARHIAEQSMAIAGKICIYTNDNVTFEELD